MRLHVLDASWPRSGRGFSYNDFEASRNDRRNAPDLRSIQLHSTSADVSPMMKRLIEHITAQTKRGADLIHVELE
jgi:hypothetical protein